MQKKILVVSFLVATFIGGLVVINEVAATHFTASYSPSGSTGSAEIPDGTSLGFKHSSRIVFDGERVILPDGTLFSGHFEDTPPPAGTRVRFNLPSDYYSGSSARYRRTDNNATLRNVSYPGSGQLYHDTFTNDFPLPGTVHQFYIKAYTSLQRPGPDFVKSGSLYNCSGSTTNRTCTYGGGKACASFDFVQNYTSYNPDFTQRVVSEYYTYGARTDLSGDYNFPLGEPGALRFYFRGDGSCGSFKQCSDGQDNDGDGFYDMLDPGCSDPDDDSEATPQCSDGADNVDPEDTIADFPNDPGCADANDNDETNPPPECNDDADNDSDGKYDWDGSGRPAGPDPGCTGPTDDSEADPPPPSCDNDGICEAGETAALCPLDNCPASLPQCSDGVDNADPEDTLVDQADPGCHTDGNAGNAASYSAADNDETNTGSPPEPSVVIPAPEITGPNSGVVGTQYSFTAQSAASGASPNDQQYEYGFDWNRDGVVNFWTPPVPEGQSGQGIFTWPTIGTKTFGVKTRDNNDNESSWGFHTIAISETGGPAVCTPFTFKTACSKPCGGGTRSLVTVNADCTTTSTTEACNVQACSRGSIIIEVPPTEGP